MMDGNNNHIEEVTTTTTTRRVISGSASQRSGSQSLSEVVPPHTVDIQQPQPQPTKLMEDPYERSGSRSAAAAAGGSLSDSPSKGLGGVAANNGAYTYDTSNSTPPNNRYSNLRSSVSSRPTAIPTPPSTTPQAPRSRANSLSNSNNGSRTNTPIRRASSLNRGGGNATPTAATTSTTKTEGNHHHVAPLNSNDLSYSSTSYGGGGGSTTRSRPRSVRGVRGADGDHTDSTPSAPITLSSRQYDTALTPSMPIALLDTTPDEWFHEYQALRAEAAEAKEEERQRVLQQKKDETGGGVGYKIGRFFSDTTASIKGSVKEAADSREVTVWENHKNRARQRLAKYWPYLSTDDLIVEFDCEGIHNNKPVRGHLLLTKTMLCFLGKCKVDKLIIVDAFPLVELASYTKGVSVPCNDRRSRWVMDVPNELVKPDAIQLYMREGQLHQFLNVVHPIIKGESTIPGTYVKDGHEDVPHLDRFVNYLDHAWRSACGWSPRPSFGVGEH